MDELLIREFLKNKNQGHDNVYDKFKEFMMEEKFRRGGRGRMSRHQDWDFDDIYDRMDEEEFYNKMKRHHDSYDGMSEGRMYKGSYGEHFDEPYAKMVVSKMYHEENGRKYVGEKFDMEKAREISERYRGILPPAVTPADIYVAINAQYHDYCDLFKAWFGDSIDLKIIESAITFWFKDVDYKHGNKIWNYINKD